MLIISTDIARIFLEKEIFSPLKDKVYLEKRDFLVGRLGKLISEII